MFKPFLITSYYVEWREGFGGYGILMSRCFTKENEARDFIKELFFEPLKFYKKTWQRIDLDVKESINELFKKEFNPDITYWKTESRKMNGDQFEKKFYTEIEARQYIDQSVYTDLKLIEYTYVELPLFIN